MYYPLISIALGSVLGAWLRWFLGLKLNPIFSRDIPLGTVTVNFVGGFIIGFFAISYFSQSALSPNYKLFLITGFWWRTDHIFDFFRRNYCLITKWQAGLRLCSDFNSCVI